jgi:hypothetical protein
MTFTFRVLFELFSCVRTFELSFQGKPTECSQTFLGYVKDANWKTYPQDSSGCKAVVLFGVKSWFFPTKNFRWQISHRVLVFLYAPFNKRNPWVFLLSS